MPLSPLTHLSGSEQGQPSTDRRAPAAQVRGVEQEGRAVSSSWWMNCTRKKKKKKALLRPYKLWEGTSPFTALKQPHPSPKRRYSVSPRLPDGPRGAPPKQRSPRSRHSAAPPSRNYKSQQPLHPHSPPSRGRAARAGTCSSRRPPLRGTVKWSHPTL